MIYETIDDANISTTSFQPMSNDDDDGDETLECFQSNGIESFDCTQCGELYSDQKSLDAHLRNVSNQYTCSIQSIACRYVLYDI